MHPNRTNVNRHWRLVSVIILCPTGYFYLSYSRWPADFCFETGDAVAKVKARVLLVDDDPGLLRLISMRLESVGHTVVTVENGEEALATVEQVRPDVVISDLRMEPVNGLELLQRLHVRMPGLPVLLMTAYGTIPDAVEATQNGAYSFVAKPVDKDDLLAQIDEILSVHSRAQGETNAETSLLTRNAEMLELLAQARMVAGTDSSVLIQGESGTGKELLARYVHEVSPRAQAGFVAVNCSAIPEALLESELFGHVRGAFTGANRDHPGLFRQAHGGTLFLDEIGDMPASLQVKLLRALEERRIRPVGSTKEVEIDVRVISATHRNLSEAIQDNGFREDLYYRLNVVTLRLPPLRERRDDIPLLVERFLTTLAENNNQEAKVYSPEAMAVLVGGEWPGNVRELQNVVERNIALSPAPVISLRQAERAIGEMERTVLSYSEARADFTRAYLVQLLNICEGNVSQAARMAERNRTDFYKLLSRHKLDASSFKQTAIE